VWINLQLFSKMKENVPKFRHKVVAIPGDCNVTDLGIKASDRILLVEDVTHVFHVAATVRFDEKLRLAVGINVMGTHNVLDLAKQMTRLKVPASRPDSGSHSKKRFRPWFRS
jgi:fatty acyl-CoA reductase